MFERAILHPGFAVVETLSECSMFFPGSFDSSIPRKGGEFELVDETNRNMESTAEAMTLAEDDHPGKFGVYLETRRPTKNELERAWLEDEQAKYVGVSDKEFLRKTFKSMQ